VCLKPFLEPEDGGAFVRVGPGSLLALHRQNVSTSKYQHRRKVDRLTRFAAAVYSSHWGFCAHIE
jgi:hypothetical protein